LSPRAAGKSNIVNQNVNQNEGRASDLQAWLVAAIKQFVAESPLNCLRDIDGSPMWGEPLVAFADGDDPLFLQYKTAVGEFHLTPREALARHLRALNVDEEPAPPRVGVVSWVLPVPELTRRSNREMIEGPSLRWNHTRFQGEEFNDALRRHVVSLLTVQGYRAVAPMLAEYFAIHDLPNGPASNWSERHIAYAAGHGTFSLSDGLITARGIAHRCGSVVFDAAVEPSPRPYSDYREYCPFPHDGTCGACIKRCPAGAISPQGHDKIKCNQYMSVALKEWKQKPGYIGKYVACGLCQTRVPCEARIPKRKATVSSTNA